MAEWFGHLIASAPDWLFMPLLILAIIISVILWWIWATAGTDGWPFKSRSYWGEDKNDKK